MSFLDLKSFMHESLRIEGINRLPSEKEMMATRMFLAIKRPTASNVEEIVEVYQPNAVLRREEGRNVSVGGYHAPAGGPFVERQLGELMVRVVNGHFPPWRNHCDYELLHPFTDGNGRSGRTVWLWQMMNEGLDVSLPFLHRFYYQTLASQR